MNNKIKVNPAEVARKSIGLAVVKNRSKVISLLKKYGVSVDNKYTDDELIVAILTAMRSNNHFKKDLHALLVETTPAASQNFVGENDFFFTGDRAFFFGPDPAAGEVQSATTTPTTAEKTAFGSFLQQNLGGILNTGLTTLSASITNKSNQKLADTALAIEAEKTKQASLIANGGGKALLTPTGLSTGAKIGIGIAVAGILGTIVYFIVKK